MFGRVRPLAVQRPRVVVLTLSSSSPSPSHPHRSTRRPRHTAHALRPRCCPDRHGARRHQALDRPRASRPLFPSLLLASRCRPCADSVPSHPHPSSSRSAADGPHVPAHRPALAKIKNRDLRALASSCASLSLSRPPSCADGLACLSPVADRDDVQISSSASGPWTSRCASRPLSPSSSFPSAADASRGPHSVFMGRSSAFQRNR